MGIVKCNDYIEEYRQRAKAKNINELSGRGNREELTEFIALKIIESLNMTEEDIVVDIGCGDGTLLSKIENCKSLVGVSPSIEEVEKISKRFVDNRNIKILQGLAQKITLNDDFATKIVCNGVFILMSKEDIEMAFNEIYRISKDKSLVFIGEIPFKNEAENKEYGDSLIKWLVWLLKNRGIKSFTSGLTQIIRAYFSKEPFIIAPKKYFFMNPDEFIIMAQKSGLQYTNHFIHEELDSEGNLKESATRYDYIFHINKEREK